MSNKIEFERWLETQKQIKMLKRRRIMSTLNGLEKKSALFEVDDVMGLNAFPPSPELSFYREYLEWKAFWAKPKTTPTYSASNPLPDFATLSTVNTPKAAPAPEKAAPAPAKAAPVFAKIAPAPTKAAPAPAKAAPTLTDEVRLASNSIVEQLSVALPLNGVDSHKEIGKRGLLLLGKRFAEVLPSVGEKVTAEKSVFLAKPAKLVFDLVSGYYADIANDRCYLPMVSYVEHSTATKKVKKPRRDEAFYYTADPFRQFTTASDFCGDSGEDAAIMTSIHDTLAKEKNRSGDGDILCLIPDHLGDFKDAIKGQIKSAGGGIVQIPRSIAAAYAYVDTHNPTKDVTFWCYDYESGEPCKTEIHIHWDKENKTYTYMRMARRRVKNPPKIGCDEYLRQFEQRHSVTIPESVRKTLVSTKDILRVLVEKNSILFETKKGYNSVDYDEKLACEFSSAVCHFAESEVSKNDVCCVLTEFPSDNPVAYSFDKLMAGCKGIVKRIAEKGVIWREYLPELSLEVIHNRRFNTIQLVKKGDYQNISLDTMDEEIEIELNNGRFSLPFGKEAVYLPLTREEFGETERDKMAKFCGPELENGYGSVEVDLRLTYRFGDPDSYKLYAKSQENEWEIQSEWCEQSEVVVNEVVWPKYDNDPQVEDKALNHMEWFTKVLSSRLENINDMDDMDYIDDIDDYFDDFELGEEHRGDYAESNLFYFGSSNYKNRFIARFFKMITDASNYHNNNQCRDIFNKIYNGIIYKTFFEFIYLGDESKLAGLAGDNKSLHHALKVSVYEYMSMLGVLYTFSNKDVPELIDVFSKEKSSEYIINASRCITEDTYGVFPLVAEKLKKSCKVKELRNISSVCWLNSSWIFSLYRESPEAIKNIINTITEYLTKKAKEEVVSKTLKVRDVMEVALAICRLREVDETILNPNDKQVKDLVAAVKEIDRVVYEDEYYLRKPFESRVRFNRNEKVNDGLANVSDTCYLLITQLTGSKKLDLLGFTDD